MNRHLIYISLGFLFLLIGIFILKSSGIKNFLKRLFIFILVALFFISFFTCLVLWIPVFLFTGKNIFIYQATALQYLFDKITNILS